MFATLICRAEGASAQHTQISLPSNDYTIDASRGPVVGPGRALGLAGAFTSLVDGVDGMIWNPASVATRSHRSTSYVNISPSFSYNRSGGDLLNTGHGPVSFADQNMGLIGGSIQAGGFGIGNLVELRQFTTGSMDNVRTVFTLLQNHLNMGYSFFGGQFVLGLGWRYVQTMLQPYQAPGASPPPTPPGADPNYVLYAGHSAEGGFLIRPVGVPLRFGASFRSEASATTTPRTPIGGLQRFSAFLGCDEMGRGKPDNPCYTLPNAVVAPWQIDVGVALQLGPRPFNVAWIDPAEDDEQVDLQVAQERADRERRHITQMQSLPPDQRAVADQAFQQAERDLAFVALSRRDRIRDQIRQLRRERLEAVAREYFLIAFDLQILGPIRNGMGLDAFIAQAARPAGRLTTVSPRVALEAEPWSNRLKLRVGVYFEPSRYADNQSTWRTHITGGLDFRLFTTTIFGWIDPLGVQISYNIDAALDGYQSHGFGLGSWF